jgi:hypothetical protein
MLWECREARNIWQLFNEFVTNINQNTEKIRDYDHVFKIGNIGKISKVKMKIIQGMIQIDRPNGWTIEKINDIANDIRYMELYNNKLLNKK